MRTYLVNLIPLAWAVVALALVAPLILARVEDDSALLRFLRARVKPILPFDREELRDEIGVGVRVSLFLMVPLVLFEAFREPHWSLVIVLAGPLIVLAVTLPLSLAHTFLLRVLSFRGVLVSTAAGLAVGSIARRITGPEYGLAFVMYCAAYGLSVGVWRLVLTQPLPDLESTQVARDTADEASV